MKAREAWLRPRPADKKGSLSPLSGCSYRPEVASPDLIYLLWTACPRRPQFINANALSGAYAAGSSSLQIWGDVEKRRGRGPSAGIELRVCRGRRALHREHGGCARAWRCGDGDVTRRD